MRPSAEKNQSKFAQSTVATEIKKNALTILQKNASQTTDSTSGSITSAIETSFIKTEITTTTQQKNVNLTSVDYHEKIKKYNWHVANVEFETLQLRRKITILEKMISSLKRQNKQIAFQFRAILKNTYPNTSFFTCYEDQ